jgi:divalent metal cation (Fe/Co/Zn/Cd) transporter
MAQTEYERFDDDIPSPKFTIVTHPSNENLNLFTVSEPSLSAVDEKNIRHAMITLNIISVFVSSVCGAITFFLAIEEQSSSALGFATDTILDVLAFAAIIWRFISSKNADRREKYVLRIMAILFIASGLAVFIDSIIDLFSRNHPLSNYYLVIATAIQTIIFFCLALAKYFVAKKLNAISAYSDALNTFLAGFMALSVGISITIYNSNGNIWYIDPIIGMFISLTIICYGIWMMYKSFKKF